jgi:hypothetical protein
MHESFLDTFFSTWYEIQKVDREQQRQGIDRIFARKDNGAIHRIEYKADTKASQTGNAFVETISVDTANKPGWAHSSQADFLIYYLPVDMLIYVIAFKDLRKCLPAWQSFKSRKIPNRGYYTVGLLVPLDEFEKIATEVISI